MKYTILISILFAVVQSPCGKLDDYISEWRHKHHIALSEMRFVEDAPQYAEYYIHPYSSGYHIYDSYNYLYQKLFEDCGRVADINLVYDDYSRHRVLQLLKNEFEEGELDTLVKRHASISARKIVNAEIWKKYGESDIAQYNVLKNKDSLPYKMFLDSLIEIRKPIERDLLVNTYRFELQEIIKLAGGVEYEGIEEQLERMFNDATLIKMKDDVFIALVRHKVEPYYTNFFEKHKYDPMKYEEYDRCNNEIWDIKELVKYAPCQKSILYTIDYLKSNDYYILTTADGTEPVKKTVRGETFALLCTYLINSDFMRIIKDFSDKYYITDDECQQVINWLKANYGKYEIRRFW